MNLAPMQVSKWLRIQVLLDEEEMENLLSSLGDFGIFVAGSITKRNGENLEKGDFLDSYRCYINTLKNGNLPKDSLYRTSFSSIFTKKPLDHFFVLPVNEDEQMLRISKPVIQLQLHRMDYSPIDGKFRPMVFGSDCVDWGIQFSYPQLYRDPETHQVEKVGAGSKFPNTELFHKLRKWCRQYSLPTPFIVDCERQVNVPIRLGKQCFSWINRHPQLAGKKISVKVMCSEN